MPEPTDTVVPQDAPAPTPVNVPLTNEQKLTLMSIQRKRLAKQLQINAAQAEANKLDQELQVELAKVTQTNHIDPTAFTLDDDLELVLIQK